MKIATLAFVLSAAAACYYDPAGSLEDGPPLGAGDSASPGKGDGAVAAKRRELKGGSRLKAKIVTGEDGSEAAIGLYDTKLGVDCAFAQAEDGKMRCLPTDLARSQIMTGVFYTGIDTGGAEIFLDSACSRRAALALLCNPSVKFMRYTEACGGPVRIAEVVERANASLYYYTSGGNCSANPLSQPSGTRLYGMGRVMAATEFVLGAMALE